MPKFPKNKYLSINYIRVCEYTYINIPHRRATNNNNEFYTLFTTILP